MLAASLMRTESVNATCGVDPEKVRFPERVIPANVGAAPVWMFCGVERVIDPAPLDTVTWFAVPVRRATAGAAPVLPINNCPFVGAAGVVSNPAVPEYKKLFAVKPDRVRLVILGA